MHAGIAVLNPPSEDDFDRFRRDRSELRQLHECRHCQPISNHDARFAQMSAEDERIREQRLEEP